MAYTNLEKKRKQAREYAKRKRDSDPEFKAKWYENLKKYRQSGKEWERVKQNPVRMAKAKIHSKATYEKNKDEYSRREKERTKNIADGYLVKQLKKEGIGKEVVKIIPEILEVKRLIIKIKRFNYAS